MLESKSWLKSIPRGIRLMKKKILFGAVLLVLSLTMTSWLFGIVVNPFRDSFRRIDIRVVCPTPTYTNVALNAADLPTVSGYIWFEPDINPECANVTLAASGLYDVIVMGGLGFISNTTQIEENMFKVDSSGRDKISLKPFEHSGYIRQIEFKVRNAVDVITFSERRVDVLVLSPFGQTTEIEPGAQGLEGFDRAEMGRPEIKLSITGTDNWRILQSSPEVLVDSTIQNALNFGPVDELRARIRFSIESLAKWQPLLLLAMGTLFGVAITMLIEAALPKAKK